ncbi:MAG: DEAD/DEAH box helicase family protein [Solirubrobacterales bacterium]
MTPSAPKAEDIKRVEEFAREPMVLNGDDPAVALAPGTLRRRAFDTALEELESGRDEVSREWARKYALVLGLERAISDPEPKLVDGTTLNAHQVDVLSGTLAALMTEEEAVFGEALSDGAEEFDDEGFEDDEIEDAVDETEDEAEADDDEDGIDWDVFAEEEGDAEQEDDVPRAGSSESYISADAAAYDDEEQLPEQPEDPNAARRFWFEHATGAGKSVAALGFVEASRTGGILILTHRRNLVDQFIGELVDRGYKDRLSPPMLGSDGHSNGPVTVETYQWFVRHAGNISDVYSIVICDEAHTALGEKTSAAIRRWKEPIFVGMTATGALIARHVTDLFPTQTSRFDLAQAARRGVIAPLRCVRIPPGPGVRTIANVPLRRGEVDQDFDQEELAALLDQAPFNLAIADLYRARFKDMPGVVYAAGVRHAYNVAEAFREMGIKAKGVSGETPKRELAETLAAYERGELDVLVNAQLLAEGWNSPRATICMHLAPTASKRIYQQRVGRVTRRHPGKEAGIVIDFVHPATPHDDPVVTLHSLLGRDVYRGGAIVVGPVRRGRGRRLRVERRVLPVTPDPERRAQIFERELWRISVANLDWGEQRVWAQLAGSKANANNWRRARAMIQHDRTGELRRHLFLTALERNKHRPVRLRALQDLANSKDPEAYDYAVEIIGGWQKDERREATKLLLKAIADKNIGSREQSTAWIWALAGYTRDLHEQYAVQRWPETKRLLGLLVNSSGPAHGRNARRIVQETRKHDLRLAAAILAAAVSHSTEAEEALRGGRTRLARKPAALARELGRNFPKARGRKGRRRRGSEKGEGGKKPRGKETAAKNARVVVDGATAIPAGSVESVGDKPATQGPPKKPRGNRRSRGSRNGRAGGDAGGGVESGAADAGGKPGAGRRQSRSGGAGDGGNEDERETTERRARVERGGEGGNDNGQGAAERDDGKSGRIPVLGSFEELSRGND